MSEYGSPFNRNPYPYPQPPVVESSSSYGSRLGSLPGSLRSQTSFSGYDSFRSSNTASVRHVSRFQEHMHISHEELGQGPRPETQLDKTAEPASHTAGGGLPAAAEKVEKDLPAVPEQDESSNVTKVPTITFSDNTPAQESANTEPAAPPTKPVHAQLLRVQKSESNLRPSSLLGELRKQISTPAFRGSLPPPPSPENVRTSIFGSLRRSREIPRAVADLPYVIPPLTHIQPPVSPPKPLAPPRGDDLPYVLPLLTHIQVPGEPSTSVPAATPMVARTKPCHDEDKILPVPAKTAKELPPKVLPVATETPKAPAPKVLAETRPKSARPPSARPSITRERVSMDVHASTVLQMNIAEQRFAARPELTAKERRDAEKKSLRVKAELDRFAKGEEKLAAARAAEERKRRKAEDKEAQRAMKAREKERKRARARLERRYGSLERFAQNELQMRIESVARKVKRWVGLGTEPGWE